MLSLSKEKGERRQTANPATCVDGRLKNKNSIDLSIDDKHVVLRRCCQLGERFTFFCPRFSVRRYQTSSDNNLYTGTDAVLRSYSLSDLQMVNHTLLNVLSFHRFLRAPPPPLPFLLGLFVLCSCSGMVLVWLFPPPFFSPFSSPFFLLAARCSSFDGRHDLFWRHCRRTSSSTGTEVAVKL